MRFHHLLKHDDSAQLALLIIRLTSKSSPERYESSVLRYGLDHGQRDITNQDKGTKGSKPLS
jgi:hypothetical protein